MKAFARTYWLELVLFAVALVGDLMVLPFLPEQVPVLWNLPACPASKWTLLFLAVVQFPGACLARSGLHVYFERYPARAFFFGCLERLVPLLFSVALLVCQLSSVLGAFGLFFPVLYVLLAKLVFLVLLCISLAVSKHRGRTGRGRSR